jgi:ADP-ribosyl-[dinitrogen reductase] hydrolase
MDCDGGQPPARATFDRMSVRTSVTHPIRVDFIPKDLHGLDGQLGMTFAPGKKAQGIDGHWQRDLTLDMARLRTEYATDVLVSLVEEQEMGRLHILGLPAAAEEAGITVDRFAIADGGVPADAAKFAELVERTVARMRGGKTVVIHCRGGLGRTGVLAAACLRAVGVPADRAIEIVRAARPGTIENAAQEDFVRNVVLLSTEEIAVDWVPTLSRFRGCLLGGALGDSLGEPVEFVGSAKEITSRFGVGAPVRLGYAHSPLITDDTQMTLFAAEGIIRAGDARWDDDGDALTRAVQAAFLRWLSTQEGGDAEEIASSPAGWLVTEMGLHHRRAPGNTCLSALEAQVGAKTLASVTSVLNTSKGCGAVMRAAPFGLAARTREQAFRWGRDTGAITHGHASGYLSAAHFAAVVWGVSRDEPILQAIERASGLLRGEPAHDETSAAVAKALALVPRGVPSASDIESLGGAWVGEEALAIALLCAATCEGDSPDAIAEALWRSVAHAGDSDSTGSMVGNLLGAMHGVESLPTRWLDELELRSLIDRVSRDLHSAVEGRVDENDYPVDPSTSRAPSDDVPIREFEWHGAVRRDGYKASYLEVRDAIANAAKAYEWTTLFLLLESHPDLVNGWRLGGTSWYAPLHQAARGGAPGEVVERLLALGAWRTLRTRKGELPVDIARQHGHERIVSLLEPKPVREVDAGALERMQGHFHEVIRGRIANLDGILEKLRLPELVPLTEYPRAKIWFAVPGMYGGFSFWLESDRASPMLMSESSCRVVEGSGEVHEVTPAGARRVRSFA